MLKNNTAFRNVFLLSAFLLSFVNLHSQIRISSPYSRYGIGDIQINNTAKILSLGGTSLAYRSPYNVNYANPASYTAFDSTSFVFEGSLITHLSTLETSSLTQESNFTSLGNLLFGFPITGRLKGSFGLIPYSSVGYKISDVGSSPYVGNVEYTYEGSGGINRFYIGQSYRINKKLSIGINASYLFGTLEKTRSAYFPDSVYVMNSRIINSTIVRGFYFNYGLQYIKVFENKFFVSSGIVFGSAAKLKAKDDILAYTYQQSTSGDIYIIDTVDQKTNQEGTIKLPADYGIGLMIGNAEKWMLGIDYTWQNWKNYSYYGGEDSLQNSSKISIGGELVPKYSSISKYWKRIHYRFGAKYEKTYLELKGNQLKEMAVSIGFGFPLRRSLSTFNVGVEYGTYGTTDQNLIKENYFKISISFSVYERWFIKPKFY
ncbi:hypothetical protein ACFLRZ_03550 [Bacteroidota bacterium]